MKRILLVLFVVAMVFFGNKMIASWYDRAGQRKFEQEHYNRALKKFSKAIFFQGLRGKANPGIYYHRALTYEKLDNHGSAEADYRFLISASSGVERALYYERRAELKAKQGDLHNAVIYLTHAIEDEPTPHRYQRRAELQIELQRYDEAIADYQAAGLTVTEEPVARFIAFCQQQADSAYLAADHQRSAQFWEYTQRLSPALIAGETRARLLTAYTQLGKKAVQALEYNDALTYFKKSYQLDTPRNKNQIVNTLILLAEEREKELYPESAARYYDEILSFDPQRKTFVENRKAKLACLYLYDQMRQAKVSKDKINFGLMRRVDAAIANLSSSNEGAMALAMYFSKLNEMKRIADEARRTFGLDPYELEEAIRTVDHWRAAHLAYKEAMNLAKNSNCHANSYSVAFNANADMMTQWIVSTPNLMKILGAISQARAR